MFRILTLNKISSIIHLSLTAENYVISSEEPAPHGILVRSADMHDMEFPEELLAVARAGAGVNNIPIEDCTKKGIAVFNTPGANANAVAELVIAGLMLGSRNVIGGAAWVKTLQDETGVAALVEKGKNQFVGPEVRGKTLGVIGLGAIGAIVANAAAQGLGMKVIGYDPYISVDNAWSLSRSIRHAASLAEVYREADYLTVHVPLNDSTREMWNAAAFSQMKDGVRLLNYARAGLCNEQDLAAALESGKVASYVTDFPNETVLQMKNTVCIPHLGASTPESEENCAKMASEELREYLEFGQIRNAVNLPEVLLSPLAGPRVELIHENEPGLISAISAAIGARKINIDNMVSKSRKTIAVTVLDLDSLPDERLMTQLMALPGVVRVHAFEI